MRRDELFREHFARLVGRGCSWGMNQADAEDLASEAITRALEDQRPAHVQRLNLIHYGLYADAMRGRPGSPVGVERPIGITVEARAGQTYVNQQAPFTTPDEQVFRSELRRILRDCTREQAYAFAQHYILGRTLQSIADERGTTREAVRQRAEKVRLRIIEEAIA